MRLHSFSLTATSLAFSICEGIGLRSSVVAELISNVNREVLEQQFELEWAEISQNDTRQVFNFGIGSLTSFASRQHTSDPSMPEQPAAIATALPGSVNGVIREFGFCWRYVATSARFCTQHEIQRGACVPVVGVYFEILKEEWVNLRSREKSYDLLKVRPSMPLPRGLDYDGYFFVWGDSASTGEEPTCEDSKFPPIISTAYWDFIIGGLLAWDGQLLDTERYTWDLDAELEMQGDMISKVVQFPSISLEERRKLAVQLVNSTKHSNFPWVNDRACPFTSDSIITPQRDLAHDVLATGLQAAAIGSVSPPSSETFHAFVDAILIEGGWENGGGNSIHDRTDPCSKSGFIDRSGWKTNLYYQDIETWRAAKEESATSADASKKSVRRRSM